MTINFIVNRFSKVKQSYIEWLYIKIYFNNYKINLSFIRGKSEHNIVVNLVKIPSGKKAREIGGDLN